MGQCEKSLIKGSEGVDVVKDMIALRLKLQSRLNFLNLTQSSKTLLSQYWAISNYRNNCLE